MDAREKQFVQIYNANFTKFYKHARYILKDDALASDCVQESFIHIWNNLEKFSRAEYPGPYMFKSLHYRALVYDYKAKRRRQCEDAAAIDMVVNGPSVIESNYNAMLSKLDKAVEHVRLGNRAKEIYRLSKIEGLPLQEIKDRLKVGTSSVWNNTHLVHQKVLEWAEQHKEFMNQL